MKSGTRIRWAKPHPQDGEQLGTVIDFWEATPDHPFSPTVAVEWDSGEIEGSLSLDDVEVV